MIPLYHRKKEKWSFAKRQTGAGRKRSASVCRNTAGEIRHQGITKTPARIPCRHLVCFTDHSYEIVKVPERILSPGVPVIEPPSCVVRFPPFSPLRSGSGCSRIPDPARIALCKPCRKQKKLHVCVQLSDKRFCFNTKVCKKLHTAYERGRPLSQGVPSCRFAAIHPLRSS